MTNGAFDVSSRGQLVLRSPLVVNPLRIDPTRGETAFLAPGNPFRAAIPYPARVFAFLPNIGGTEMVLLVVVGLLLYGRNLPEAGRSLGRVAAQLRRGWQEFKDQMDRDGDLSEVKKSLQGTADELRRVADVPRAIADPRRTLQNAARDMIESEPPPETAPAPSTTPATTDESPTSGDKQ